MKKLILVLLIAMPKIYCAEGALPLEISIIKFEGKKETKVPNVRLFHNATVNDLNNLIQSWWNIPKDQQILNFGYNKLSNRFAKLIDYGIKNNSEIMLTKGESPVNQYKENDILIIIKRKDGRSFKFYVNPEMKVSELKQIFNDSKHGYVPGHKLIFLLSGKILTDDKQLKDYNIIDGSELSVLAINQ